MTSLLRHLSRAHLLSVGVAMAVLIPALAAGAMRGNEPASAAVSPLDRLLSSASTPVSIPLTIDNAGSNARAGEPVTTGVPIGRGQVSDENSLWLQDAVSGEAVPAQFTVTSRWNGVPGDRTKAIKWVLVDLQTDVPAGGRRDYVLRSQGGSNPSPIAPITTEETAGGLIVDSGPLRVEVGTADGGLFEGMWLDSDGDGEHETTVIAPGSAAGLVAVRTDGSEYRAELDTDGQHQLTIEQAGPMHTVVALSGRHHTGAQNSLCPRDYQGCIRDQFDHLDYTVRIHAYAGKPYVRVFYSVTNPERFLEGQYNSGGGKLFQEWDGLSIELKLDSDNRPLTYVLGAEAVDDHEYPGEKSQADGVGQERIAGALDPASVVELYQDSSGVDNWQDSEDGFWGTSFKGFRVYNDESITTQGLQAAGWATVGGEDWAVGMGVRHFWQNFPKGLRLEGSGEVGIDLWPRRSRDAHQFSGGRQKTHELVVGAWPAGTADDVISNELLGALEPLHLLADGAHYSATAALGPIPTLSNSPDAAFERYEQTTQAIVNNPGSDIWSERFVEDLYGWRNWGDSYRGGYKADGARYFGNNEFDLTYANLVNYLRSGDRRLFDVAESQARQLYDIDVYHTGEDAIAYSHGVHKHDASGVVDHGREPNLSHYWIRGLLDYYLLTGDRYALDAATETATWIDNLMDESGDLLYNYETRAQAWPLLALTELWETTGDEQYLSMAALLAKGEIIDDQSLAGARYPCPNLDWEGDTGQIDKPNAAPWQNGYVAEALGRYALAVRSTGRSDAAAETALVNVLDELIQCGWATQENGRFVGSGEQDDVVYGTRYEQLVIDRLQANGDYSISFAVNQVLTDGFAYGYIFTGDGSYLDMAHNTWTWTMGPENAPGQPSAFPTYYATSTPAKNAGFQQRFGQTYLWLLQAFGSDPVEPPEAPVPPTTAPSTTGPPVTAPTTSQGPTTTGPSTTAPLRSTVVPLPTMRPPIDPGGLPAPPVTDPPTGGPGDPTDGEPIDFEDASSLDLFRPIDGEGDLTIMNDHAGSVLGISANNTDEAIVLLSPTGLPVVGGDTVAMEADLRIAYYGSEQWGALGSAHGFAVKVLPTGDAYVVSVVPVEDGVALRIGLTRSAAAGFAPYDFLGTPDGHADALDELVFPQAFEQNNTTVELGYWHLATELQVVGDDVEIKATLVDPEGREANVVWVDDGRNAFVSPGPVGLVNHGVWSIQNRYDNVRLSR